jgi:hypothetical protein
MSTFTKKVVVRKTKKDETYPGRKWPRSVMPFPITLVIVFIETVLVGCGSLL